MRRGLLFFIILFFQLPLAAAEIYLKSQAKIVGRVVRLGDIARIKNSSSYSNMLKNIFIGNIPAGKKSVFFSYSAINQIIENKYQHAFYLIGRGVRVRLAETLLTKPHIKKCIRSYIKQKLAGVEYDLIFVSLPEARLFTGRAFALKIERVSPQVLDGKAEIFFVVVQKGSNVGRFKCQVIVRRYVNVLVAKKQLFAGRYPSLNDFTYKRFRKQGLAHGVIKKFSLIKGRRIKNDINKGDIARQTSFEEPLLVTAGDRVLITYTGPGISISAPGKALRSARRGESIAVINLHSGKKVYAIVRKKGEATLKVSRK